MNTPTCTATVTDAVDGLGRMQLPQPPAAQQRAALLAGLDHLAGSPFAALTCDPVTVSIV